MTTSSFQKPARTLLTLIVSALTFTACADMEAGDFETTEKIVGGKVVKNAPDHVGALLQQVVKPDGQITTSSFCTATLIANNAILTAAHCWGDPGTSHDKRPALAQGNIFICLGNSDWVDGDIPCPNGNAAQVFAFINHQNYNSANDSNDISIAVIGRNFTNISKPQLASRRRDVSGQARSFGYGATKTRIVEGNTTIRAERGDTRLRRLDSQTINTQKCNQEISALNLNFSPVSNKHICIDVNRRNNLCHGDSGGPTFINGKLAGVTSRGTFNQQRSGRAKTCDGSGPTILINVQKYRSWINGVLNSL